ncbi:RHS repeat domain-containing protein [Paenibacillus koleovorans]|uniref:RHS repeat domain-containing protein n=1 Tax=Paenibacillus koleovorans TaxID=121608 RepID=UPI000FD87970|nr:RHS repeat-associated core domain-containing protein [Paenibacillus koleovorans]
MKRHMINICRAFFLVILLFGATAQTAMADLNSAIIAELNGRVNPQLVNESQKPNLADRNQSEELIDPQTGSLTLIQHDLSLPGRDGLNLNLSRIYNSAQAEIGTKRVGYSETNCQWEPHYIPVYQNVTHEYDLYLDHFFNGIVYAGTYISYSDADAAGYAAAQDPNTWYVGWSVETIDVPDYDYYLYSYIDYYYEVCDTDISNYVDSNNYLRNRYDLGNGWAFAFPSVQIEGGYRHFHDGSGAVYEVDFNQGGTNLKLYQGNDVIFAIDNQSYSNGQYSSAYVFTGADLKKYYFASSGILLGIKDRFNNEIKFSYTNRTINGSSYPFISEIVDSIGRIIAFSYQSTINGSYPAFPGEDITVTVSLPGVSDTYQVKYTKMRDNINGRYEPKLWRVTQAEGTSTALSMYFDYQISSIGFRFDEKTVLYGGTSQSALLTKVAYPLSQSKYEYEPVNRNLGSDGLYQAYRIKTRYDQKYVLSGGQWVETGDLHHVDYTYTRDVSGYPTYHSDNSLPQSYTYDSQATIRETNLRTTYTFNGLRQNTSVEVLVGNNEKLVTSYSSFHSTYKFKPLVTKLEEYSSPIHLVTERFVENTYYDWGGVSSITQPLVASLFYSGEKQKYTTTFTYHPTNRSLLNGKSWYQNVTDPVASSESYTYDANGRVLTATNALGQVTVHQYTMNQNKVEKETIIVLLEDGKTAKTENIFDSSTYFVFPSSMVSYYTDEANQIKTSTNTYTYGMLRGQVKTEKDNNNIEKQFFYDALGRTITIKFPAYTSLDGIPYAAEDRTEFVTGVTTSDFDAVNTNTKSMKVRSYLIVNGAGPLFNERERYYNGQGQLLLSRFKDYQNNRDIVETQYRYDTVGRPIYAKDAEENTEQYAYDDWGNVSERTDTWGNLFRLDSDIAQKKTTGFFVAASNVTAYRSNPTNNGLKSNVVETFYNNFDQVSSRKAYPSWPSTSKVVTESYLYDILGNVVVYRDPSSYNVSPSYQTTFGYDKLNRLSSVTNAKNETTSYAYSTLGQLQTTTLADGKVITKSYNELGAIQEKVGPAEQPETYVSNALLQTVKRTDPNGKKFELAYDEWGRNKVNAQCAQQNPCTSGSKWSTYYNAMPFGPEKVQVWAGSSLLSSLHYDYNSAGQVKSKSIVSEGFTQTVTSEYNRLGALTSITNTNYSTLFKYSKDRLEFVQTDGSSVANTSDAVNARYTYNPNGTLYSIIYPKLTDNTYLSTVYEEYDDLKRLKKVSNYKGTQLLSRFEYQYDDNGNITAKTDDQGTTTYQYDRLNRLKTISRPNGTWAEYSYDSIGNRFESVGEYVGSLESGAYSYDVWNQLTQVSGEQGITNFYYGPDGLRTKKSTPAETVRYVYNNNGKVIAEADAGNTILANYVWGPDRVLSQKDSATGKHYYYLYNGHGDVIQIVDTAGNIKNSYSYDEWGNVFPSRETVRNPFLYAGEILDRETGLYYLRARYYDPSIGRFINKDTYEGQISNPLSLNLYTYVENNPLTRVDPTGHTWGWALNLISKAYNTGRLADYEGSNMVFGANVISYTVGSESMKEPYTQLFTPLHEIAQINVAKKLKQMYGENPELEKGLKANNNGKKTKYEADIVLGKKVWEVKPLHGADPKPQLELYKSLGGLTEGETLETMSGITLAGNVKMRISFPEPGQAIYSMYYVEDDGNLTELSTAAAAAIIFRELAKSLPGGRRFSPAF